MTPQGLRAVGAFALICILIAIGVLLIGEALEEQDPPAHHTEVRPLGKVGMMPVYAVHDTEKNVTCYVTAKGGICCVKGI